MVVEVQFTKLNQDGELPKQGQVAVIHYTGTLKNGQKFDSSRDRGKPFEFRLGQAQVIRGLEDGVLKMTVGSRATLTCSSDCSYGRAGVFGVIPSNATLVFDVELLALN
ncbi:unnamed protein product [Clavelina lepadiformis]|uniref:peptidylprolyl isomerase n=1 Tax=Clavelina lepadiformis TaxID=159417 RepID=A0ABP0GJ62_CLALP